MGKKQKDLLNQYVIPSFKSVKISDIIQHSERKGGGRGVGRPVTAHRTGHKYTWTRGHTIPVLLASAMLLDTTSPCTSTR